MKEQVALFGGSFNPPHIGHMLAVTYVLSQHVDRVIVVPTFKHAFGKDLVSFEHRMEMARLTFDWLNQGAFFMKVSVLDIEQKIGHSRTLDTIKALYDRFASDIQLRLVVGSDILYERDKWHKFDEIEKLADPIYLGRAGIPHPDAPPSVLPNISSTAIRTMIKKGEPTYVVLTPSVREYIDKHKLYTETSHA